MKRKYYMRGLGIGVLVTAILCAIVLPGGKEEMTDEEIIARAKTLGYVKEEKNVTAEDIDKIKENTTGTPAATKEPETTAEVTPEGTPGPTPSPVPTPAPPEQPDAPDAPATPMAQPTATTAPTPKPTATVQPTATQAPKPTATLAPTNTPAVTVTDAPQTTSYTVRVERGMTAMRVAQLLQDCGAVSSANDFVSYLRSEGLTDFINIGTFTIPRGASNAEIARILTK